MTAHPLRVLAGGAAVPPPQRVVVIDPRHSMRLLAGRAFERRGDLQMVGSAVDGPTGVCAALAFRPDVVVVDVELPGFGGLEVCRRVRDALGAAAPRLVLWSDAARPSELELLRAGAESYVPKQLGLGLLTERVRSAGSR